MSKILTHVVAETQGDQLRMKDGWDLVTVLSVKQVGAERHWSVVVAREVEESDEDA